MGSYYVPYMEHLSALSTTPVSISCVTHLGLGGGCRGAFTLSEQIQHKADYLREHVLLPARSPCVLIGHSIGGPPPRLRPSRLPNGLGIVISATTLRSGTLKQRYIRPEYTLRLDYKHLAATSAGAYMALEAARMLEIDGAPAFQRVRSRAQCSGYPARR